MKTTVRKLLIKCGASFDMKRRNGEHIGPFAAYGYIKDTNDKNALVIDEQAAAVVREIFSMFLDGMSKNAIVRYLNDHGILCPSLYKRECLGLKYQNPQMNMIKRPLWCAMTIASIINALTKAPQPYGIGIKRAPSTPFSPPLALTGKEEFAIIGKTAL